MVRVTQSAGSVEGRALGADRDGALRVEVGDRIERFFAGDVSLRAAPANPEASTTATNTLIK